MKRNVIFRLATILNPNYPNSDDFMRTRYAFNKRFIWLENYKVDKILSEIVSLIKYICDYIYLNICKEI